MSTTGSPPMTFGRIPSVALPVSRLILGTAGFAPDRRDSAYAVLDRFVELGGNTLDTAHVYGRGDAERVVGTWLRERSNRERVVIVGKGAHHDAQGPRVTPQAITSDLYESLERLGTSYIDLYLLHRDDPSVPVGPIVACLDEHFRAGRVRAVGGSNWSPGRLEEAIAFAREHRMVSFAAGSPNFSLALMNEPPWPGCLSASAGDWTWYAERRFPLLAWSSQAQGFFTGRFSPGLGSFPEIARVWYNAGNFERLRRAEEIGRRMGVDANAIALAYVLCQPFPAFALIGPLQVEELEDSVQALAVELTLEHRRWLNLEDMLDPRPDAS